MRKNTTSNNRNTPQSDVARANSLEGITGPLQRLLTEVNEQVFKYDQSEGVVGSVVGFEIEQLY